MDFSDWTQDVVKLLNAGCGTHYAKGWVNTDVWENEETRPDVLVELNKPYPFEDNTFDAVYLGHVLEHLDWRRVLDFLRDMVRIAKPGAPILIVGPDARRALNLWKRDRCPEWLLHSIMEHQEVVADYQAKWWDGAVHCWNCHEQRVLDVAAAAGIQGLLSVSDTVLRTCGTRNWNDPATGIDWPVVSYADWQFAVRGQAPS